MTRRFKRYSRDVKVRKGLYMSEEFFNQIDRLAEKENVSFSSFVVEILQKFHDEQQKTEEVE